MKKIDKSFVITVIIVCLFYLLHYAITSSFPPCIINKYTGFYCPGCGITRMLISICRLDFYQAFRYNSFLFILLMLTILYHFIKLITKKFLTKQIKLPKSIFLVILILAIGFGILRNIPYFSYLIPTIVK